MSGRHHQDWGVETAMTPAKLRKACDKVGGVYAMARLFSKGHPPQYLYRRINRKVGLDSAGDSLRLRPPTRPSVLPGKFQGIQRWGLAVSWSGPTKALALSSPKLVLFRSSLRSCLSLPSSWMAVILRPIAEGEVTASGEAVDRGSRGFLVGIRRMPARPISPKR